MNNKSFILFLIALALNIAAICQNTNYPINKYSLQLDLLRMNPSIQYHFGKGFTALIEFGPNFGLIGSSQSGKQEVKIISLPAFSIDFRYYPFLKQRIKKGKSWKNFEGIYISTYHYIPLKKDIHVFNGNHHSNATIIGISPGIQVSFLRNFYLNFQPGYGLRYTYSFDEFNFGLTGTINFGLFLPQK